MNSTCSIHTSYLPEEPDWDSFVARTQGGSHLQSSLWARVKSFAGWRLARIIATKEEEMVAGAQLLIKSLPLVPTIAYLPKGPLFSSHEPGLRSLVIEELFKLITTHRISYLIIQPPLEDKELSDQMLRRGFRLSTNSVAPTVTLLLDLTLHLDDILNQMTQKTRRNIRMGQRKGVHVREGDEADLHTFHRLMAVTGKRHNFSPEPEAYFRHLWRLLYPDGHVRLFLSEYKGEALSALLVIPFGNTVTCSRAAWSGSHGMLYPNEALHWTAIKWAKSQGYRCYDLDGIDPNIARSLMYNSPPRNKSVRGVTSFKAGFGGSIVFMPQPYDYIPSPALRYAYDQIFPRLSESPALKGAYRFVRNLCKR